MAPLQTIRRVASGQRIDQPLLCSALVAFVTQIYS